MAVVQSLCLPSVFAASRFPRRSELPPVGGGVDAQAQSSEYLKECDSSPSGLGP
jgi:hypothetical protein